MPSVCISNVCPAFFFHPSSCQQIHQSKSYLSRDIYLYTMLTVEDPDPPPMQSFPLFFEPAFVPLFVTALYRLKDGLFYSLGPGLMTKVVLQEELVQELDSRCLILEKIYLVKGAGSSCTFGPASSRTFPYPLPCTVVVSWALGVLLLHHLKNKIHHNL